MKLFFEDRFGRLRPIADVENKKDAATAIANFLDQYNYISQYTRFWIEDTPEGAKIIYDVGSHTEFFELHFNNYEEARTFLES